LNLQKDKKKLMTFIIKILIKINDHSPEGLVALVALVTPFVLGVSPFVLGVSSFAVSFGRLISCKIFFDKKK
jgi:hypothetical protein